MLYDKYVDKIKKVAKAKGVVLFFKFIFLAVFLVALVYSITFIANKGKLKDGIEMPSSINYGEDYEFSAKTQYGGDVRYFEYRAENSDEWSKAKPTLAGTYYVRAVSNKFIGSRKSSEYKFVINKQKLDINVSSTTITYGDYPNYSADGLKNKDVVNSLTFTFDSYGKTMTNVSISDVIVTDVNGEDVTNCYNITANGKEIGFDKKEVTFSPTMEDEFVYTGEEVTYGNTFTITNNLGYKDMAIVEGVICDKDGNVTNAILPGDYYVKINTYKVSNESEEVTCNYEVSTSKHYFSIVKRDIIIKTDSKSKTYDGTPLTCETYGVSDKTIYGLLDGDKLVNNSIGDYQSITYYEENGVENTMNIRIYDSLDNDVTDVFYNVSYDFGTLSIVKRNLVIKTSSDDTFIYDSNKHYRAELSDVSIVSGSLVDGEELYLLDMEYQPYIDMPGIKSNELKYSIRNIISQEHTFDSYTITRQDGSLIMYSKNINIKSKSYTCTYGDNYSSVESKLFELVNTYTGYDEDIVYNTTVEVEYYLNGNLDTPKNAGEYQIRIKAVHTNEKYDINVDNSEYGILTIKPKEISISLKNLNSNYKYTGNSVAYYDEFDNFIYNGSLPYGDRLKIDVDYYDSDDNNQFGAPKDANTYYISYKSYVEYKSYVDNNGNSTNYIINASNHPTFTISKRNVTFMINPLSNKTYDDKPYDVSKVKYDIEGDGFASGETITPVFAAYIGSSIVSAVNADTYELGISSLNYVNAKEANYNVNYSTRRSFTINPITLNIKFLDVTNDNMEYGDASSLSYVDDYDNFEIISGNILEGHRIKINYNFYQTNSIYPITPINAGNYEIRYSGFDITGSLASNYVINCPSKSCKINKRTIEIAPKDMTISYGNSAIYDKGVIFKDKEIVDEGTFGINVVYYDSNYNTVNNPKNVGNYYIGISSHYTNIEDFGNNYTVIFEDNYSILTINELNVEISLNPISDKPYDGYSVKYQGDNYHTDAIIPYGEDISINVKYQKKIDGVYQDIDEAIDCGEYKVIYTGFNTTPANVKSNYNVSLVGDNYITFKITKAVLSISLQDDSITYGNDGKKYIFPNTAFSATGLADSESIRVNAHVYNENALVNDVNLLDVGQYDIKANINDISLTGRSLDNYNVNIIPSKLTINSKTVKIKLLSQKTNVYYDGDYHYYDNGNNGYDFVSGYNLENNDILTISVIYDHNDSFIPVNAGDYQVSLYDYAITRDGINQKNNYVIICDNEATFTIKPRDLIIRLLDQTITYGNLLDYPVYPDEQYEILDGSLVSDEKISLSVKVYNGENLVNDEDVSKLNYGLYTIKHWTISLVSGNSLDNYNFIRVDSSKLNVVARNIELTLKDFEQTNYTYGESEQYYTGLGNYESVTGIVNEDEIEVFVEYYEIGSTTPLKSVPVNVGNYYVKYKSYKDSHNNSDNYVINSTYCPTFSIVKRNVTVSPALIEDIPYNGNPYNYSNTSIVVLDGSFVGTETIKPTYKVYANNIETTPKDVSTYELRIVSYSGLNGFDDNNYNISLSSIEFDITPIAITITPTSSEKTFNNSIDDLKYIYNYSTGIMSEQLEIVVAFYNSLDEEVDPYDAGTYTIKVALVNNDTAKKDNYTITFAEGTLTINPLTVYIAPKHYDSMDDLEFSAVDYADVLYPNTQANFIISDGSSNFYNDDINDVRITVSYKKKNQSGTFVPTDSVKDAGIYRVYVDEIICFNDNYNVVSADEYQEFEIEKYALEVEFINLPESSYRYGDSVYKYQDSPNNCNFEAPEDITLTIYPWLWKDGYLVSNGKAKDAGSYTLELHDDINEETFSIVGGDINNYTVKPISYSFKVIKRDLDVTIADCSKIYTGSIVIGPNYDGYNIDNEEDIVSGDSIELLFKYMQDEEEVDPISVGDYSIVIDEENSTLGNYKLRNVTIGTLTIEKEVLHVYASSKTDSKTDITCSYTGSLVNESYIKAYAPDLSEGDEITDYEVLYYNDLLEPISRPKEIGYYYVQITNVKINGSLEIDYNIINDELTRLIINSGNVTIYLVGDLISKEYGEVINPDSTIVLNQNNSIITSPNYNKYHQDSNYIFSVKLNYKKGDNIDTPKNFGNYNILLNDIFVNGQSIDDNLFNIVLDPNAELEIYKKVITIIPVTRDNKYEVVYNGDYLSIDNLDYKMFDKDNKVIESLPYNDEVDSEFNNVYYRNLNYTYVNPINAGTYLIIIDENFRINDNYICYFEERELTINKAVISADRDKAVIDVTRVYDGNSTSKSKVINNYVVKVNGSIGFIYNEELDLTENISLVFKANNDLLDGIDIEDAKEYIFTCYDFTVVGGEDRKINYVLSDEILSSKLTILKRDVTITTGSYNGVYDGASHNNKSLVMTNAVEGHVAYNNKLTPVSVLNVDSKENTVSLSDIVIKDNNVIKTQNYNITLVFGTLEVTEKEVHIKTLSKTFVYNGKKQPFTGYKVIVDGVEYDDFTNAIVPGEKATVIQKDINLLDAGDYQNEIIVTVKKGIYYDIDSTYNYKFIFDEIGVITINKLAITFELVEDGILKEYDNESYTFVNSDCENKIIEKDNYIIKITFLDPLDNTISEFKDAGNYTHLRVSSFDILDEYGQSRKDNYDITITNKDDCNFEITPKKVHVRTTGQKYYYDGQEHYYNMFTYVNGVDSSKISEWNHIVKATGPSITNIGSIDNELEFTVKDSLDKDITHNYDFIIDTMGVIEVENLEIEMSMNSYEYKRSSFNMNTIANDKLRPYKSGLLIDMGYSYIILYNGEYSDKAEELGHYKVLFSLNDIQIWLNGVNINGTIGIDGGNTLNNGLQETYQGRDYYYLEFDVVPREIFVMPSYNTEEKTYDGTPLCISDDNYNVVSDNLLSGDKLVVEGTDFLAANGTEISKKVRIASATVINSRNKNVSEYYNIHVTYEDFIEHGYAYKEKLFDIKLKFEARDVYVKTEDRVELYYPGINLYTEYDGPTMELGYDTNYNVYILRTKIKDTGLLEGHRIMLTSTRINSDNLVECVLDHLNKLENYYIVDENGNDITQFYNVDSDGTLSIDSNTIFKFNFNDTTVESVTVINKLNGNKTTYTKTDFDTYLLNNYGLYCKPQIILDDLVITFRKGPDETSEKVNENQLFKVYAVTLDY